MRATIEKKVLNIIESMEVEKTLTRKEILYSDYVKEEIFSSIEFVLLIVLIEEEFGLEIDGDDLLIENLATFKKVVDLIERLL